MYIVVLTAGQTPALNAVYTPVGTGVRYARQANPISLYMAAKGKKPLNLQPVVVYDAVGISHELPAVDEKRRSCCRRRSTNGAKLSD